MDGILKKHLDNVADRLLYGVMAHSQMVQYYDFLSLSHYADAHAKHYHEESDTYHKYTRMLIGEYNYIYRTGASTNVPKLVPDTWEYVERFTINNEDRKKEVAKGLKQWLDWEEHARKVFRDAHDYTYTHGELYTAAMIRDMIGSVNDEIRDIKQYISKRSAIADAVMVEEDKYHGEASPDEKAKEVADEKGSVV